jgi:hypothetical protein
MREAAEYAMPAELRSLLATICVFGTPRNAILIFDDNIRHLSEDFLKKGHSEEVSRHLALFDINRTLASHGKNNGDYDLPAPDIALIAQHIADCSEGNVELSMEDHARNADAMQVQLNQEQSAAYGTILEAVRNPKIHQRQFFLDGPGGCGKTFPYNAISSKVTIVIFHSMNLKQKWNNFLDISSLICHKYRVVINDI